MLMHVISIQMLTMMMVHVYMMIALENGGSSAEFDDCGVCGGDNSTCSATLSLGSFDSSGSLEILYDFGAVAGFQFDVTGLLFTGDPGVPLVLPAWKYTRSNNNWLFL